jgi:REP element-mobilizing transposase RayT
VTVVPRKLRSHLGDGIFQVVARGNRRQGIFHSDRDYMRYLALLGDVVKNYEWRCGAYALMPNHVHILVACTNGALSQGMQRLQGVYAQWFNGKYRVDGHLFQDRFHAWLLQTEAHFFEDLRYIVLNPVRAGLCADPEEWPWSSFAATSGSAPVPAFLDVEWILKRFSGSKTEARKVYAEFVRAGGRASPGTGPADLIAVGAAAPTDQSEM